MEDSSCTEENAVQRRQRLKSMREEASLAGGDAVPATPPEALLAPPLLDDCQGHAEPPSFCFEFYTDPLAAFTSSRRNKKSRNGCGGDERRLPGEVSPSSFQQTSSISPLNPAGTGLGSPGASFPHSDRPVYPNFTPPGSFSPVERGAAHSNRSSSYQDVSSSARGRFNSFVPQAPTVSMSRGNPSASPRDFSTPGSSVHVPLSAPCNRNEGFFMKSPPSSFHSSGGRGSHFSQSPQRYAGGVIDNCVQSELSWGSFKHSPGSSGRGTPGKSRGRFFHRSKGSFADSGAPESFAKRSMLEDPWKDLVPVRIDSVASRLDSCSISTTQAWLPKSIGKTESSAVAKGVSVPATGPSLAESLAASFAEAVADEQLS